MERPHLIGAIVRSKHVNVFEWSSILSERSAAFVKQMSRESLRTRCETRNSTHVIFQVISLVTCGTGARWTSRIQSTARKIGASLISRSRAFFNNGRWFGWNSGHPTGHVRHLESRIGKLVSPLPSLGCRNTSANLQGHIARARDLYSNSRNLTETWWLLWRPLGWNALSGNEVDMCGLLFSVSMVLATKFQRLL